jgi:hypothetical protein
VRFTGAAGAAIRRAGRLECSGMMRCCLVGGGDLFLTSSRFDNSVYCLAMTFGCRSLMQQRPSLLLQ